MRNFFVKLPSVCGLPDDLADIEGDRNGRIFDWELTHPHGLFARGNFESYEQRIAFAWSGWESLAQNQDALQYAKDLAVYACKCYSANAKGETIEGLDEDRAMLESDAIDFPEVTALLSVEQASVLTSWN